MPVESSQEESRIGIGEVLSRLEAEFPDVTVSKLRYLESQGLISPDRSSRC